jgi:hypothetical protein
VEGKTMKKEETRKTVVVIRDGETKLRLARAMIRADGTIWYNDIPLLDAQAPGALDRATAAAAVRAKDWDKIPPAMYARMGTSASGLIVRDAADVDAEQRAAAKQAQSEYDAANPGAAERRKIHALFAHARARRDAEDDCNTMDYYRISAEASAKLKAWREKYPAEARAEDAEDLRAKADKQRELAAGAFAYDCDGSLSADDQQRRHDEFLLKAAEYEKQAAELIAK